jgi:hypothetical protein
VTGAADPRDAPWTDEEVQYAGEHFPEFVGQAPDGRRYITVDRRAALSLEARYPTHIKRPGALAPVAGETAEQAVLRARYPTMR